MSKKAYPWYLAVDGRPTKVVGDGDVRSMDPATGAMVSDNEVAELVKDVEVKVEDEVKVEVDVDEEGGRAPSRGVEILSRDEYLQKLDRLRQPILERYATAPLEWKRTGDWEVPYAITVDGHELSIRDGDFPDEALYILLIDGQEVYEIDDWPSAWIKPPPT